MSGKVIRFPDSKPVAVSRLARMHMEDSMRRTNADYLSIEAALQPHQLRTLKNFVDARGGGSIWRMPVCCAFGITLAVNNRVSILVDGGMSERQALARAAADFDLDYETLQRQRRADKHKNGPVK
jgi:hypothetical protein